MQALISYYRINCPIMNNPLKPAQQLAPAASDDDDDVPASERGKEEQMSMDRREPSLVFGFVGLSYLIILLLLVVVFVVFWIL